jgi:hypothetical protein
MYRIRGQQPQSPIRLTRLGRKQKERLRRRKVRRRTFSLRGGADGQTVEPKDDAKPDVIEPKDDAKPDVIDESDSSISSDSDLSDPEDEVQKISIQLMPPPAVTEENEIAKDPWNAVCVVGLRVYSKDSGVNIQIVSPKDKAEKEDVPLDVDNSAADAVSGAGS